ncbi:MULTISPECIES: hypothetical protein [Kordiimonas]|nr:hypothetical protein [Kordiimonas sp. UBA4487]
MSSKVPSLLLRNMNGLHITAVQQNRKERNIQKKGGQKKTGQQ